MKFVYFLDKKLTFQHFFLFSSDVSQTEDFIYFFFSSDEGKKTLVGARRPNNLLCVALGLGRCHAKRWIGGAPAQQCFFGHDSSKELK